MLRDFNIKTATAKDLRRLCRRAKDGRTSSNADMHEKWISERLRTGPAYTLYYRGKPAGAAGLSIVRAGVANAWAVIDGSLSIIRDRPVPTCEQMSYLADVVWVIKEMTEILKRRFEIKRIRAASRCGFDASQRLLKACGFSRKRKFGEEYLFVAE